MIWNYSSHFKASDKITSLQNVSHFPQHLFLKQERESSKQEIELSYFNSNLIWLYFLFHIRRIKRSCFGIDNSKTQLKREEIDCTMFSSWSKWKTGNFVRCYWRYATKLKFHILLHIWKMKKNWFCILIMISNSRGNRCYNVKLWMLWVSHNFAWLYWECTAKLKFHFLCFPFSNVKQEIEFQLGSALPVNSCKIASLSFSSGARCCGLYFILTSVLQFLMQTQFFWEFHFLCGTGNGFSTW